VSAVNEEDIEQARTRILASLARLEVDVEDLLVVLDSPRRLRAVQAVLERMTPAEVETLDRLVGTAKVAVDAKYVAVILLDDADGQVLASREKIESAPRARQYCQMVVGTNQPFRVDDAPKSSLVRRLFGGDGPKVGAYLGMPVTVQGQTVGAMCLVDPEPHEWSVDEERLLARFAAEAGTELEKVASGRN
jgi:GAF domain-containing protein